MKTCRRRSEPSRAPRDILRGREWLPDGGEAVEFWWELDEDFEAGVSHRDFEDQAWLEYVVREGS